MTKTLAEPKTSQGVFEQSVWYTINSLSASAKDNSGKLVCFFHVSLRIVRNPMNEVSSPVLTPTSRPFPSAEVLPVLPDTVWRLGMAAIDRDRQTRRRALSPFSHHPHK